MVESSDEPNFLDRIRSSARKAYASYIPTGAGNQRPVLPLTNQPIRSDAAIQSGYTAPDHPRTIDNATPISGTTGIKVADKASIVLPPPAPPPPEDRDGEASAAIETDEKPNVAIRFYKTSKEILLSSWLNTLLIFVPVGIAVQTAGVNPTIVFAMNAIAIIPLAGLLSHATESVASELGDTIGALMNVTFGNAVELIIL